jgi:hypothetical protein
MISNLRTTLGLSDTAGCLCRFPGKTTALFRLAHEYQPPVIVTATAHLEYFQIQQAGQHFYLDDMDTLPPQLYGITLISDPKNNRSVAGLETGAISQVLFLADKMRTPLLIEAVARVLCHPLGGLKKHPFPRLLRCSVESSGYA